LENTNSSPHTSVYQPAILIECKLTFRSLRASTHYDKERIYTTWYPEGNLPVDWDRAAIDIPTNTKFSSAATENIPLRSGNFIFTPERIAEMEEELISSLARTEKLALFYNPVFKIYSSPYETRDQFLERVSEKALSGQESELKELMRRFELKLEQVREAEERKGRKEMATLPEIDMFKALRPHIELLTSKARLTKMFLNSAKLFFQRPTDTDNLSISALSTTNRELHETLCHIEQEACEAVSMLCDKFLENASQCDSFEIGLQRQNIKVLRCAILWLATPSL
jgi:hypothetical protein